MPDVQPVHLADVAGESFGWLAMPTVPAAGDLIDFPGMENPLSVERRLWSHETVPYGPMTMVEAGLAGRVRWVAVLTVAATGQER